MPAPWRIRDYAWGIRDHLWEWDIVERIRQGCAAPHAVSLQDLIVDDSPHYAMGWEAAERHAAKANRIHSAYLTDAAIAKRAEKREQLRQTMEEVKAAWRAYQEGNGPRPAWGELDEWQIKRDERQAAAKAAAERRRKTEEERAQWAAARAAEEKIWADGRAERERLNAERMAEWQAAAPIRQRQAEERAILASKWICTECNGTSGIQREGDGYRLTCSGCGKSAFGSHEAVMKVRAP